MTEACRGRKGYICSHNASFFVTFYVDGTDGRYTCGTHLPVAVRQITKEMGFGGYLAHNDVGCAITVKVVK